MNPKLLRLIFAFLFFGQSFLATSQTSTVGKEFWLGYMENNRVLDGQGGGAPDYAVLIITANETTTGAIEYLGQSLPFSINAGQQFALRVLSQDLDLLHRSSGTVENKGIHITSTGDIAVHAFNERVRSADGTVVLPVGALGTDYYITSHFEELTVNNDFDGNANNESLLLVVATEDNTEIEITTSVNSLSGDQANIPSTIVLDRGQSYQIKARADLTGSRVRVVGANADECKKIAVFGGNKWTSVGNCGEANDHLFQQAYPVNTWGTSFVHMGLMGRSSGEMVKVLASEDDTEVFVNGSSRGTVDQGEFLTLNFAADQSGKIDASKPASVTVFSKSMACNDANAPGALTGDPFMITYSPSEQFLKTLTFNAIDLPSIENHYVNVVVKAGTQGATILDGQNIGSMFSALPGDSGFQYARIGIGRGVHSLENTEGFAAYVYGFGELESYGYAAGAALDNLNFEPEVEYDFVLDGEKIACFGHEGTWKLSTDNPDFTYFVWDFGDGSDSKTGQEVSHTFTASGTYEVKVLAAISPNSCDQQEEVIFEVEVIQTVAFLEGETSVCPEVEQVMYRASGLVNVHEKIFEIDGGTIVEDYGDSVLVNWGVANPNAKIRLIPYSENGCPGDPLELAVTINERIVVGPAVGDVEVCFDPLTTHTYSAPATVEGRGYDWTVTGGQIISGQGETTVEVSWDQPGITGIVEYTAYSLLDTQCEGKADALQVNVAGDFEVSTKSLTAVACAGESSGSISLEVVGGVSPYQFVWNHDASLNSAEISGLAVGTYSVQVTDQLGCVQSLENIVVSEPEVLSLASLTPVGVSCYGRSDGTLALDIVGGVAPYSLEYAGGKTFSGQISFTEMPAGVYSWEIKDANGCVLTVEFEITSPAPIDVEVRLEKPACPGGSNGELIVLPQGGVEPFVYFWKDTRLAGNYVTGLSAGTYELEMQDASGCIGIGQGIVREAVPTVRMPTGFDPRQAPGTYSGVSPCDTPFTLWIYNRWGQLIYNGTEGWDGTVNGEDAGAGTYTYFVRYQFVLDGVEKFQELRGGFTLIR